MAKVNLDALIPREDFEITDSSNKGQKKETISIEDLKPDSFFIPLVRKPDFQRETNEWDSEKIVQLIESFISGDLIPALILWRSPSGLLFVIDGSHRLSSLLAWINDDYGDGYISKTFYGMSVPAEQIVAAENTRKLVKRKIGTYSDLRQVSSQPEKIPVEIAKKTKNLGALAIQLQWIEGDVTTAEKSFFKINQEAVPINKTELILLESRNKPNCIAARAVIRSGTGHKYWSQFTEDNQKIIQQLAKEINELLFLPTLETPLKTLNIPMGGKLYSAQTLPLVLEFINLTNNLPSDFQSTLADDEDGNATIRMLRNAKTVAQQINSMHPSSLGLHPFVYFYSEDGRHKIASFYATVSFVMELFKRRKVNVFVNIRKDFEEIIIEYDYLIQQINRKFRSSQSSFTHIRNFFLQIVDLLQKGTNKEDLITQLLNNQDFDYLTLAQDTPRITSKSFSSERKSAVFAREAIRDLPRCKICGGFLHKSSITIDHITTKRRWR